MSSSDLQGLRAAGQQLASFGKEHVDVAASLIIGDSLNDRVQRVTTKDFHAGIVEMMKPESQGNPSFHQLFVPAR